MATFIGIEEYDLRHVHNKSKYGSNMAIFVRTKTNFSKAAVT